MPVDGSDMPGDGAEEESGPVLRPVGAACSLPSECAQGGGGTAACLSDLFFPGGYCTNEGCDTVANDCPGGGNETLCLAVPSLGPICLDRCDPLVPDCRLAYRCVDVGGRGACFPGCMTAAECPPGQLCDPTADPFGRCHSGTAAVGDACNTPGDCPAGSICASESSTGFPGGACIVTDCVIADPAACPVGSVCVAPGGGSQGICLEECAATAPECDRPGYGCSGLFSGACGPQCRSDTECATGRVCGPIGLCFDPANLGRRCTEFTDCPGGSCISEGAGFPRGVCSFFCSLADGCPGPAGEFACISDGTSPYLCIESCVVDADCSRQADGYSCGGTTGALPGLCAPACTDDAQCSALMTCDVRSGSCR